LGVIKNITPVADRPCFTVRFGDGSKVNFYVDAHPRAAKVKKHIYIKNPDVLVDMATVNKLAAPSPAPVSHAPSNPLLEPT